MAQTTKIEWATSSWNPWIGCSPVSPACTNCYAKRWAKRYGRDFSKIQRTSDKTFYAPMRWKEPKKIFVCSLSDFFHPKVDNLWGSTAQSIMEECQQHTFIILTKRPENITVRTLPENVWLGVTVENQEQANKRIPLLLQVSASVRFISCEPLLEEINIEQSIYGAERLPESEGWGLDWVICGGETGPGAREMNPDWARSLREQCKTAGVKFFMKQMTNRKPIPEDLMIREFPEGAG